MQKVIREKLAANDELLLKAYGMDNIKMIDLDNSSDICYIFFSDHGLYWPNYRDDFETNIIQNNYFEWENLSKSKKIKSNCSRIIFVRDIWVAWYSRGISYELNTVDKLVAKLADITKGYKIITVGNSAGGYMATLVGMKLKGVMHVINFSGYFVLHEKIEEDYIYYDLKNLMKESRVPIFYFCPFFSEEDKKQYNEIKDSREVRSFLFASSEHGHTMYSENIPIILSLNNEEIQCIYEKCKGVINSKWKFLFLTTKNKLDIVNILLRRFRKTIRRMIDSGVLLLRNILCSIYKILKGKKE